VVLDPDIFNFDWAPTGVQLAYSSFATGSCGTTACPLIYIYALGGAPYLLTDGGQPAWSSNGAKIAFRTNGGFGDIATINPDGSGRTTILQGHAGRFIDLSRPRWSPAGTHLTYHRFGAFGSNIWEVYRATANGSSPANLTGDLSNPALPVAWR
jgi:Tol biopolymer transport system component